MKKIKFSILFVLGLAFLSLGSCSKDDDVVQVAQDVRDQYVGTWNAVSTGSLTLFQNGQSVQTVPLNPNGPVIISKSGTNALIIDGKSYILNGNSLTSTPTPETSSNNGVTIILTVNSSGTLGSNIINLNETVTGTWNATTGASGNCSGNAVTILTR